MTILNSTEILAPHAGLLFGCVIFGLIATISFIICWATIDGERITAGGIAVGCLVFTILFAVLSRHESCGNPTGRYKLEVTLNETVSFVEMNEKYEFIEQRGDIYVFKTREVEDDG